MGWFGEIVTPPVGPSHCGPRPVNRLAPVDGGVWCERTGEEAGEDDMLSEG